ncbi:MAG: substrate-binding domain-containing protein [Pseudomonadota bacterium]
MTVLRVNRSTIGGALLALLMVSVPGGEAVMAAEGVTSDLVNRRVLRVCADPANLPFSGKDEPGFENKIADIVADELDVKVEYTWFPQATGFIRRTLFAKRCDLVVGYAQGDEMVLNTNAYYRSAYALVYPKDGKLDGVISLSDPKMKDAKIGLVAGSPPASVIVRQGLMGNVRPYQLVVDRRYDSPSELMIKDLTSGEIDVGVLWGPIAGYFSKTSGDNKLKVVPLLQEGRDPRMTYRITMGVRQSDTQWKRELNEIIAKRQGDIDAALLEYGVPLIDEQDQMIAKPRS